MSAEQKETEQNALATTLTDGWTSFKQGKLISYKLMAVVLIVVVGAGVWWYIAAEGRKARSQEWLKFDEARSVASLEELEKTYAKSTVARVAEISVARSLLGPEGIDQLGSPNAERRQKAVESVEKAREEFAKLLPKFEKDPVFKAECLLGLAKAEAALVGVPVKPNELTEFRGKVSKVVEYLDQLAAAAAPDTPWATDSKKLADALRNEQAQTSADFVRVQRALTIQAPLLPEADPHGLAPGGPPGMPRPPGAPK
ncbi:unnamed protein product [Gemmataceae bacterium]|nr:unnamed protein product [Gemmataceae bacterium]VTT97442.1 unnamed protein product [Gemmataceae bacterium]